MRLVLNTDTVPAAVNRYLLPYERQLISLHRHPAALVIPSGVVVAGLVAALVLSGTSGVSGDAVLIIWLIWVLLLLYLIGKVLKWIVGWYVITSYRILFIKGFFTTDVAMLPLVWTADMKLRRSTMGRVLGYGQLIFESRSQDHAALVFNFMPYPEQIYLEISGLIFPDRQVGADADSPPETSQN